MCREKKEASVRDNGRAARDDEGMSDFGTALVISLFLLFIFIAGFWLGVSWQEDKNAQKARTK